MKFTIDRSKWRCGYDGIFQHGRGETQLLNQEGYMCCLGQIELQLGLTEGQIKHKVEPIHTRVDNILTRKCYYNSDLALRAMDINDNSNITPEEREQKLIKLFAAHNHELEFTGEYVK